MRFSLSLCLHLKLLLTVFSNVSYGLKKKMMVFQAISKCSYIKASVPYCHKPDRMGSDRWVSRPEPSWPCPHGPVYLGCWPSNLEGINLPTHHFFKECGTGVGRNQCLLSTHHSLALNLTEPSKQPCWWALSYLILKTLELRIRLHGMIFSIFLLWVV